VSPAAVGLTGFAVLGLSGALLEARARRRGGVRAAAAVSAAMRTRAGRAAVLGWWLWLGAHFLAR
jgi:hypothetical protein